MISMQEWFEKATPEQCDAMSALQLDYRFERDHLNMWWRFFQELGFHHNGVKYELPESAPACEKNEYDGNEIYERLDRFAVPQLTSAFQEFPEQPEVASVTTNEQVEWWRQIRDKMIFRKFRIEIEISAVKPRKKSDEAKQATTKNKQTSLKSQAKRKPASSSSDPGADLYMKKSRKGSSKNKKTGDSEMDMQIVFPTIEEYAEMAWKLNSGEVEEREESYVSSFEEWRFLSSTNQSLLFYGVGSKRTILNRFADEELQKDGDVLIIDGFDKDVTIQGILELIVYHWLGGKEPGHNRYDVHVGVNNGLYGSHMYPQHGDASTVQRAIAIAHALARVVSSTMRPLYLVLHNIDGIALRNPTTQEALAGLVSLSTTSCGLNSLRLVASVDHVNGPALLWDSLTRARFRWIWTQVHTHRPYIEEVTESKISDGLPKSSLRKRVAENDATEESIFYVLTSLAPRITEVLQQLASLQLSVAAKGKEWIDYMDLLRQCQLKMCVNGDSQLRIVLGELSDHGIVDRNDGPAPVYRIPYSENKLKQILNYKR
jgi:origin recognition complex subunit 2